MKKLIKRIFIILLIGQAILAYNNIATSSAYAASSVDLSAVGTGARPMGMGKAYVAIADDVNAVFTNPAGLGYQKDWALTSMSTKMMDRVDYKVLGAVYSTKYGTLGVGYLSASTPAGYLTTDKASIASATPITYGSNVMIVSFGKDLSDTMRSSGSSGKLSVGANYKMSSSNFSGTDGSSTGSSIDLGLLFRANEKFSAGVSLQNVGGSTQWKNGAQEEVAMSTKLGLAYNLDKVTAAADVEMGKNDTLLYGGVEYRPFDMLALRAGFDQTAISASEKALSMTAGVGVNVNGIKVDYAYRQDGSLSNNSTSYVSISFQPETKKSIFASRENKETVEIKPVAEKQEIAPKAASKTDGVFTSAKRDILNYYK